MKFSISTLLLLSRAVHGIASPSSTAQRPLKIEQGSDERQGISIPLFASLERLARLVDITYCVGTSGVSKPFNCVSRCQDFPTLELAMTWNTGMLMSDSCGYIAVDHGTKLWSQLSGVVDGKEVHREGAIIVAFRGTYSLTNTVVDLSTVPQEYVPYPPADDDGDEPPNEPHHRCENCTVHMGFLASWRIARQDVMPTLKPLRANYPDYPIVLVGHSLGGAVAALASLEMKAILRWENIMVTTFGEPRTGNKGFTQYFDAVFDLNNETNPESRTYRRVTHIDDPVPLLPLTEWGYRSHGGEIFISKPDLSPAPEDIRLCVGDYDPDCIAGSEGKQRDMNRQMVARQLANKEINTETSFRTHKGLWGFPARLKLWQLLFAHRDYFWRLGLCVPGGDPIDWGRDRYPNVSDEL